ncbi:restriction endonuclease [Lysobacter sp. K5869]|uniref:restriction endonuclease n=1 Tax=Lysobacter sp. K5869 TaxID=2820808 RepID=UPI001C05FAEA|nr:restriction endonuclease [Lysobacter sp. K5869]QWP77470.1 restriction endonuclease [Lysobacter sp. K5869]
MLTLIEKLAVAELGKLLYDFLPASGNRATSFPIAAAQAGIPESWPMGFSKGPGIERMLEWTLVNRRDRIAPLLEAIVGQSMSYRGKGSNPLTREEVSQVVLLTAKLGVQLVELSDPAFLDGLARQANPSAPASPKAESVSVAVLQQLERQHIDLASLAPHPRGYAFEKFLSELFSVYELAPRASFRIVGEQIDGSFRLDHETYLLEAKWVNAPVGAQDLYAFTGKVQNKATWARGVFISNSGFSSEGLIAYGKRNPVVCIDGFDLNEMLRRRLPFDDVLRAKVRRAAETGDPMVHVRNLFP